MRKFSFKYLIWIVFVLVPQSNIILATNSHISSKNIAQQTEGLTTENSNNNHESEEESWYEKLLNDNLFWLGILIPFLFMFIVAIQVRQKIRKNKKD